MDLRPKVQPNRWSCLPTAFAIAMNTYPSHVIAAVGHDGSQIINPNLPEPQRRRAFHIQEMTDVALASGYMVIAIQAMPCFDEQDIMEEYHAASRLQNYLAENSGVLVGPNGKGWDHAVAWSHEARVVLDPNGTVYGLEACFSIREFYIVRTLLRSMF